MMQAQKLFKYKFFLVLLLCCAATAIPLVAFSVKNVKADYSDGATVTVHYRLFSQRSLENRKNMDNELDERVYIWYEYEVPLNGKLDKNELNKLVSSPESGIQFYAAEYLSEKDRQKINNQQIVWYVSNRDSAVEGEEYISLESLKESEFDFDTKLLKDIYLEGIIVETASENDTKWMFWAIIGAAGLIILVSVIMAVIRNRTTRLSLDNRRLMSTESKTKLEEIKNIERRKEKYSPLNDNIDDLL